MRKYIIAISLLIVTALAAWGAVSPSSPDGKYWFANNYKASSLATIATAGARPGIMASGYTYAAIVYGGGGSGISNSFIMQGFVSELKGWFNLSAANTLCATSVHDSSAVLLISNIAYLDSIRLNATAISTSDTLYYKIFLYK